MLVDEPMSLRDGVQLDADPLQRSRLAPEAEWFENTPAPEGPTAGLATEGLRSLVVGHLNETYHVEPHVLSAVVAGMMQFQPLYLRVLVLEINLARSTGRLHGPDATSRYANFVRALRTTTYRNYLFEKYPSLARWFRAQTEHLVVSANNIERAIEQSQYSSEGSVADIEFVGDSHISGQQSAIVTLGSGRRIVLKRRPWEFDELAALVAREVSQSLTHPLRLPNTTRALEYVVSEFLESAEDPVDPVRLAYVFGAWLAFFHYLNTTDLHFENFLSTDSGPVPVDLECGLSPRLSTNLAGPDRLRHERVPLSRSSILPAADSPGSFAVLWSPLAGEGRRFPGGAHHLVNDGTDEAALVYHAREEEASFALQSSILSTEGAVRSFQDGFTDCQRAMSNSAELIRTWAEQCGNFRSRVVRKPTRFYLDVMRRLAHPRYLIDPKSFANEMSEILVRSGDERDSAAHVEEHAALLDGFIPSFHAGFHSSTVESPRGRAVWPVQVAGAQELEFRLSELQDARARLIDREEVANSLAVHLPPGWVRVEGGGDVDAYGRVMQRIWMSPPSDGEPALSWSNLIEEVPGRIALDQPQYDLYHGKAGLLLATLQTGREDERTVELRASLIEEIRAGVIEWQRVTARFGLYMGGAGAVYALTCAAEGGWTPREDVAEVVREGLTDSVDLCVKQEMADVFSGSAGLLLLLGQMRDAGLGGEWAAPLAARLLDHIRDTAVRDDRGFRWWKTGANDDLLGGFAHGAAGIAAATGLWRDTALGADLHSSALVSQGALRTAAGRWRDLRSNMSSEVLDAWCHGASGILLADGLAGGLVDPADVESWERYGEPLDLTLCHGLAGAVVVSADVTGANSARTRRLRDSLLAKSDRLIREQSTPSHLLSSNSLFMGVAGVAFALDYVNAPPARRANPLTASLPRQIRRRSVHPMP